MTVKKTRDVRKALNKKLMATEDETRRHITYVVTDDKGVHLGQTYISHGHDEISDPLLTQMARQLNVNYRTWLRIIECPGKRKDYIADASQPQAVD